MSVWCARLCNIFIVHLGRFICCGILWCREPRKTIFTISVGRRAVFVGKSPINSDKSLIKIESKRRIFPFFQVTVKTKITYSSDAAEMDHTKMAPDTTVFTLRFEIPQNLMDSQIEKYRNIEQKLLYFGMIDENGTIHINITF